jgi:hypothetical protein
MCICAVTIRRAVKRPAMPLVVSVPMAIQPSAMLAIRPEEPTRLCIHAAEVSAPNWR